jgi:hypothetical protein
MYKFWIEHEDGSTTEWTGLTEQQAVRLYNMTKKHINWTVGCTVKQIGWGEMK